jgi:hypothetical protein
MNRQNRSINMNALEQAKSALEESKRQIEYLHGKFQATGTGNTVLAQIDAALSALSSAETAEHAPAAFFQRINKGGSGEFVSIRWNIPDCDIPDEGILYAAPQQAAQPAPAWMTDELPPLPCAELSMPLHGLPSVHLYTADQMREYALLSRSNAPQPEAENGVGMLTAGVIAWALITPTGNIRYWSTSRKAIDAHQAQCPNESLTPIIGVATAQPEATQPHSKFGSPEMQAVIVAHAIGSAQPAPMPVAPKFSKEQAEHYWQTRVGTEPPRYIVEFANCLLAQYAALPLPAQQVQNKQEVNDALQKAFMTLQSSGGEDRSIVLKFNHKENAYIVHDFLLHCAVKDDPSNAGAQQVAEQKDAERYRWLRKPESGNVLYAMALGGECGRNMDITIDQHIDAAMTAGGQEK